MYDCLSMWCEIWTRNIMGYRGLMTKVANMVYMVIWLVAGTICVLCVCVDNAKTSRRVLYRSRKCSLNTMRISLQRAYRHANREGAMNWSSFYSINQRHSILKPIRAIDVTSSRLKVNLAHSCTHVMFPSWLQAMTRSARVVISKKKAIVSASGSVVHHSSHFLRHYYSSKKKIFKTTSDSK